MVEVGGPEKFPLDELVRKYFAATKDPRQVVTDPKALYYGIEVSEKTLIHGDDARLSETRFVAWLHQSASGAAAGSR
jgi:hypothetical protein